MNTLLSCDPGAEGAIAMFTQNESGEWKLKTFIRNDDWRELAKLEPYNALAVIEFNHGIRGQAAGTTFTQGFNQGEIHRTLELTARKVDRIAPQRWQSLFGVPRKKTFPGKLSQQTTAQKNWTRDKVEGLVGVKVPLWAADAVAIGLSYLTEMKENG